MMKLLSIDDDPEIIEILRLIFEAHKNDIPAFELFTDVDKLLAALTPNVHICIIDYYLKGITGLNLINKIVETNPYCWFIMFSGQTEKRVVIEFMNNTQGCRYVEKGTPDFIEKLIFYIKDITKRVGVIEKVFYKSFRNREALGELKDSLIDLKNKM